MNISTITYDNNRIGSAERKELSNRLFGIFSRMWGGYSFEQFENYFFATDYETDKTIEYYHDNELIGYVLVRLLHIEVDGKPSAVMRVSANVLPDYMGLNLTTTAITKEGAKFFFKSVFSRRNFYIFVTANSPASYCAVINRTLIAYPSPYTHTPPHISKISHELATKLNFGPDPKHPFKCKFAGVNINDRIRYKLSLRSSRVSRYFTSHCPNYDQGGGTDRDYANDIMVRMRGADQPVIPYDHEGHNAQVSAKSPSFSQRHVSTADSCVKNTIHEVSQRRQLLAGWQFHFS